MMLMVASDTMAKAAPTTPETYLDPEGNFYRRLVGSSKKTILP
jgi:hypothetical protein